MRTRARDGIYKPRKLFTLSTTLSPIPSNYRYALSDPNWSTAMRSEYSALVDNETWRLVPKPSGANVVSGKWVYRHKFHSDGSLARYKARWVVQIFSRAWYRLRRNFFSRRQTQHNSHCCFPRCLLLLANPSVRRKERLFTWSLERNCFLPATPGF
jgi:hypothetical protein